MLCHQSTAIHCAVTSAMVHRRRLVLSPHMEHETKNDTNYTFNSQVTALGK